MMIRKCKKTRHAKGKKQAAGQKACIYKKNTKCAKGRKKKTNKTQHNS